MKTTDYNFYDTILWRAKEATFKKIEHIKKLLENETVPEIKDKLNAGYENEMNILHKINDEIFKNDVEI